MASDSDPHGTRPPGTNGFWRSLIKKVEELWDWMHSHQAEVTAWWGTQWQWNKTTEKRLDDHETRIRANEHIASKAAFGAVLGGMFLAAIFAAIAAALGKL